MEISYLMLGGNVGNREDFILRSIDLLNRNLGTVTDKSAIYESEPWGFEHSGWFLNQAVALETNCKACELLEGLQNIEKKMGRVRTCTGYQARTIDIDILFFGNHIVDVPNLVIPHPHIAERLFVLKPMAELAPCFVHPVLKQTMKYMKEHCADTLRVDIYQKNK